MVRMLLSAFVAALAISLVFCAIALQLFPGFRSREHKEGIYRPDQSTGAFHVGTRQRMKRRSLYASSSELPLVGGPPMLIAVAAAALGVGMWLRLDVQQWTLLIILLAAMAGFGAVGLVDDWLKYRRGKGISEVQKLVGVVVVSLAAAIALNRRVSGGPYSARFAYPPYSDVPLVGQMLQHTPYAWIAFFLLMTVLVASTTSLATDFSDGMDGLCGGLLVSAALAFAVILLTEGSRYVWPLVIASLAIAGAALGFLPFNWPSSWKGRGLGRGKRRARLIMGDTGSLALGGMLALVAVMSRMEPLLIIVGGVFVLEGLSALVSARILVRFFRLFLVLDRYDSSHGFAHTEFPLPFLGTPMHHHFDLLGWDRQLMVYEAWLLSAVLGLLGVASAVGQYTWERYLARLVALLIMISVWQMAPRTRSFFLGLTAPAGDGTRYLSLNYGFPYRLFGVRLSGRVDTAAITPRALRDPAERLMLWQRMSVFDARSLLGYFCFREGAYADAYRIWDRIPDANLEKRPEIEGMVKEARIRLGMDEAGELGAQPGLSGPRVPEPAAVPLPTSGLSSAPPGEDPNTSQWRTANPVASTLNPPRLERAAMPHTGDGVGGGAAKSLWTAHAWATAAVSHPLAVEGPSAFTPADIYGELEGRPVPPPVAGAAGAARADTESQHSATPEDSAPGMHMPLPHS